jgi:DnaJ-domain-containing protein 1
MRRPLTLDTSRDTYYVVLGIPETATQVVIKRAYRGLIKRVHPDKHPDASAYWKLAVEQDSRRIIEAYKVLSDSTQRSAYDQQLALYRQQHTPPPPLKAATASASRSYTSPADRRPQTRVGWMGQNWAFLAILLILSAALSLLLYIASVSSNDPKPVFQSGAGVAAGSKPVSQSGAGVAAGSKPVLLGPVFPPDSAWETMMMIRRLCSENPTSSYHFFDTGVFRSPEPLSWKCSDWLRRHQPSIEGESLRPAGGTDKTKAKSAKQR